MRKLLLIATLSLGTFACAQTMAGNAQPADQDVYNQKIAEQTNLYIGGQAANAASVEFSAKSGSWSDTQPGSMASNTGSTGSQGADFYNRTIDEQTRLHLLDKAANQF
jgi:hypothetical protein